MDEKKTQAENEQPEVTLDDLKAELERLKAENSKLKTAQSNASSDAAKWKKELRDSMDAKTRAEAETKELIEQLKAENETLKKSQSVSAYATDYIGLGFEAELGKKAAEAFFEGDHAKFAVALKSFLAAHDKALAAEALRNTPRPGVGGVEKSITKEQFNKMNYKDRAKLFEEQPELYQELIK